MKINVYTDGVHLVADSLQTLHEFAQSIGLGRHFYEGIRKGHPHYDLTTKKRLQSALDAGAITISSKDLLLISQQMLK